MVRGGEVCGARDGEGRFRILLRSDRRPIRVAITSGEGDLDRLGRVGALGPEALSRKPIDLRADPGPEDSRATSSLSAKARSFTVVSGTINLIFDISAPFTSMRGGVTAGRRSEAS